MTQHQSVAVRARDDQSPAHVASGVSVSRRSVMNMLLKSSAAIAAVPVAAPVIASADVATHATARVVEPEWPLANELKSLFVEFFELAAQRSKLHAEAKKAASVKGRIDEARWDEALEQNGYCQCARQVSKLLGRMRK